MTIAKISLHCVLKPYSHLRIFLRRTLRLSKCTFIHLRLLENLRKCGHVYMFSVTIYVICKPLPTVKIFVRKEQR